MIEHVRAALRREMERAGIAAKTLSRLAGLNESAVRDILKHVENPGVFTMMQLADALDVPLEALLPPARLRALERLRPHLSDELARMAEAHGVTVEDLLDLVKQAEPETR